MPTSVIVTPRVNTHLSSKTIYRGTAWFWTLCKWNSTAYTLFTSIFFGSKLCLWNDSVLLRIAADFPFLHLDYISLSLLFFNSTRWTFRFWLPLGDQIAASYTCNLVNMCIHFCWVHVWEWDSWAISLAYIQLLYILWNRFQKWLRSTWSAHCSTSWTTFNIISLSHFGHFGRCVAVLHFDLNTHFLSVWWCWTSSYMLFTRHFCYLPLWITCHHFLTNTQIRKTYIQLILTIREFCTFKFSYCWSLSMTPKPVLTRFHGHSQMCAEWWNFYSDMHVPSRGWQADSLPFF